MSLCFAILTLENNKSKKSVKFQRDVLIFCYFFHVFVISTNHHFNPIFLSVSGFSVTPNSRRFLVVAVNMSLSITLHSVQTYFITYFHRMKIFRVFHGMQNTFTLFLTVVNTYTWY